MVGLPADVAVHFRVYLSANENIDAVCCLYGWDPFCIPVTDGAFESFDVAGA